jgi:hypothetical protein
MGYLRGLRRGFRREISLRCRGGFRCGAVALTFFAFVALNPWHKAVFLSMGWLRDIYISWRFFSYMLPFMGKF